MAELSIFWTTGATGDGATPYTQAQITDWLRRTFINAAASEGVLLGYANALACTGTASPIAVNTGAAVVYGFPYENTAGVNLTVTTPVVGTTGGHVVLRVDWTAQTVRLVAVRNSDGVISIPALTQTPNTTWEIRLCSFTVTTGGVITITDTRAYCHFNTAVSGAMIDALSITAALVANGTLTNTQINAAAAIAYTKLALTGGIVNTDINASAAIALSKLGAIVPNLSTRQGGDPTDWSIGGASNYTLAVVPVMKCGVAHWTGGSNYLGTLFVTFDVAFSAAPVVTASPLVSGGGGETTLEVTPGASSFEITWRKAVGAPVTQIDFCWFAIGPA